MISLDIKSIKLLTFTVYLKVQHYLQEHLLFQNYYSNFLIDKGLCFHRSRQRQVT